jgi:hypothetical protein
VCAGSVVQLARPMLPSNATVAALPGGKPAAAVH